MKTFKQFYESRLRHDGSPIKKFHFINLYMKGQPGVLENVLRNEITEYEMVEKIAKLIDSDQLEYAKDLLVAFEDPETAWRDAMLVFIVNYQPQPRLSIHVWLNRKFGHADRFISLASESRWFEIIYQLSSAPAVDINGIDTSL
jgi:hypothetical protein